MVGGSVALTYNRLLPVFTLSTYRTAVPYNRYAYDPEDASLALLANDLYWEDRKSAALTISFPRTHKTTIFAKLAMTTRQPHSELPADTVMSLLPATGRFGTIQGGWRYSWGRPTAYAVSPEDARMVSVIGGLLHPNLGSAVFTGDGAVAGATQVQLTAEVKEFIVNPWLPNHVLAMRAAGGLTAGSTDYLGYYQLGGAYGDSAATVTPDEFRMLRGYNLGADVGDRYWLSSVEYRLPIMRFDRGVDWLPLFFGHSSGAVFVDAGNAFGSDVAVADAFNETLVGVGGEVTIAGAVGWWSGWRTRLGYALALTQPDIASSTNGTFYAQVGSSF
jgi:outer membrane protein assembly factor BamA